MSNPKQPRTCSYELKLENKICQKLTTTIYNLSKQALSNHAGASVV
jgi:hypothetical protein